MKTKDQITFLMIEFLISRPILWSGKSKYKNIDVFDL